MKDLVLALCCLIACLGAFACDQGTHEKQAPNLPTQATSATPPLFSVPKEVEIQALCERGPEGEIVVSGKANLPDGTRIWIEIVDAKWQETVNGRRRLKVAHDSNVEIHGNSFRSDPLLVNNVPASPGPHKVNFLAYFNGAWQSKDVLTLVGPGGKNLKGKLLKKEDPDVIDSDLILDYTATTNFPPPSENARAISLVKKAVLSTPENDRSSMSVQNGVAFLTKPPSTGVEPGKGWSATLRTKKVYEVVYGLIDASAGESQAIWTVDLGTGKVQYANKYGKFFSWVPKN